jgi:hypothetical protein
MYHYQFSYGVCLSLGVPGVQNHYTIGWALGMKTLYHYFIGCCILLIIYTFVSKIAKKNTLALRLNLFVVSAFRIFFMYVFCI